MIDQKILLLKQLLSADSKGFSLAPHLGMALRHPYYTIIDSATTDVLRSQQSNRERMRFPSRLKCDRVVLRAAVKGTRIQHHRVSISLHRPFLSSI